MLFEEELLLFELEKMFEELLVLRLNMFDEELLFEELLFEGLLPLPLTTPLKVFLFFNCLMTSIPGGPCLKVSGSLMPSTTWLLKRLSLKHFLRKTSSIPRWMSWVAFCLRIRK
jgi:hypothetical protein